MVDTRRRAVIALAVSVVGSTVGIAGAGHAYLREWRRAFAWFTVGIGAGLVLIAVFADPRTATPESLPLAVTVPLLVLFTLNTLDAYRVASRGRQDDGTGERCPSCGRDRDPELPFCPWCADRREETE